MSRFPILLAVLAAVNASTFLPLAAHAESPEEALMGCFQKSAKEDDYLAIGRQVVGALADGQDTTTVSAAIATQRQQAASASISRLTTKDCALGAQAVIKADGSTGLRFVIGELGSLSLVTAMDELHRGQADGKPPFQGRP